MMMVFPRNIEEYSKMIRTVSQYICIEIASLLDTSELTNAEDAKNGIESNTNSVLEDDYFTEN